MEKGTQLGTQEGERKSVRSGAMRQGHGLPGPPPDRTAGAGFSNARAPVHLASIPSGNHSDAVWTGFGWAGAAWALTLSQPSLGWALLRLLPFPLRPGPASAVVGAGRTQRVAGS